MMTDYSDRLDRLRALLIGATPPILTQPGDPDRQARLKGWLPNAYVQHQLADRENAQAQR